jgi:hypothetical protein
MKRFNRLYPQQTSILLYQQDVALSILRYIPQSLRIFTSLREIFKHFSYCSFSKIQWRPIALVFLFLEIQVGDTLALEQWEWYRVKREGIYKISADGITRISSIPDSITSKATLAIVYSFAPDRSKYYVDDLLNFSNGEVGPSNGQFFFIAKNPPVARYVYSQGLWKDRKYPPYMDIYYEFADGTVQVVKMEFVGFTPGFRSTAGADRADITEGQTRYDRFVTNTPSNKSPDKFDPNDLPGGGQKRAKPLRIHAMIISTMSDPTQILGPNIILTGGIAALGNGSGKAKGWAKGVQIIPDPDMLSGKKIPPWTPMIIDVRIMHYSVESKFPNDSKPKDPKQSK